jgi:hypothetical protein
VDGARPRVLQERYAEECKGFTVALLRERAVPWRDITEPLFISVAWLRVQVALQPQVIGTAVVNGLAQTLGLPKELTGHSTRHAAASMFVHLCWTTRKFVGSGCGARGAEL